MKSKRLLLWVLPLFFGLVVLPLLTFAQISDAEKPARNQAVVAPQQTFDEYQRMIRANRETGLVDPADVLKARQKTEQQLHLKSSNSMGLEWTSMGPDNVAQRTRAILIDKDNSNTLYAGAVTGGIWKSLSGGSSWVSTTVNGGNDVVLNVTSLTQSADGTIYAGTGESFITTGGKGNGGLLGRGIYKSTDGNDFSLIASTLPVTNDTLADWAYVNRLVAGPNNRIWAATNTGLRYSDNGGTSWTYASDGTGNLSLNAMDVKVGSNGIVVACVGAKCYVSESGDPTQFVYHNLGGANLIARIEFAIAPSNPDVIYASSAKPNGALDNIYRSVDKGQTWKIIGPGGSVSFNVFNFGGAIAAGSKGIYDNTIAVYPNNADQVLLGGVDMWRGKKVDDGYFSWEPVSSGFFSEWYPLYLHHDQHAIVFSPTNPNTLYIGNDGGVSVSYDGAQTFHQVIKNYATTQSYTVAPSFDDKVLTGTQDNGVQYLNKLGNTAFAATKLDFGAMGVEVGGNCAASFINPQIIILGTSNAASTRSIDQGLNNSPYYNSLMSSLTGSYVTPLVLWESFDDPNSIDSVQFISYDTIQPDESFVVRSRNASYPFLTYNNTEQTIFPKDTIYLTDIVQSKFFLGASGAVWFTKQVLDFTVSPAWFKLTPINNIVQTMAVTADGNNLFVGTQNGYVIRVRNIASYVSETENDVVVDTVLVFSNRAITSIATNPKSMNNVIVTMGNYGKTEYVYASSNALDAEPLFVNKQGNLPAMPVYASVLEMSSPDRAIIGTDMGVFSTTNLSAASPDWSPELSGMGNLPVYQLKQQSMNWWPIVDAMDSLVVSNYGVIYAATNGRGVFKCSKFVGISDPKPNDGNAESMLQVYPNPAVDQAVVKYTLNATTDVSMEVYDFTGRMIEKRSMMHQLPGDHLQFVAVNHLAKGTYLVRLITGTTQTTAKLIVQ